MIDYFLLALIGIGGVGIAVWAHGMIRIWQISKNEMHLMQIALEDAKGREGDER